MVRLWVAVPTLPSPSVIDTETTTVPSPMGAAVTDHVPPAAIVVDNVWPATATFTGDPTGAPVEPPLIVGLASAVDRAESPSIRTFGGVVSMVKGCVNNPMLPVVFNDAATT